MKSYRSSLFFSGLTLGLLLTCAGFPAFGDAIQYQVSVDTSSISGAVGSLDFNFNPGPLVTEAASLQILGFSGDGTLAGGPILTGDISGVLPGTLTFDNGTGFNDYFEGFTFGTTLIFSLSLYGPALSSPDGLSTSGSTFAFSMFSDTAGTMPALTTDTTDGFALTANVNLDGTTSVTNFSPETNVAVVSAVPEPNSGILFACSVALIGLLRLLRGSPRRFGARRATVAPGTLSVIALLFLIFLVSPCAFATGSQVGSSAAPWAVQDNISDPGNPCYNAFIAQTGIVYNAPVYYPSQAAAVADVSAAFPAGQVYLDETIPANPAEGIPVTYLYGIHGCAGNSIFGPVIFSFSVYDDPSVANNPPPASGSSPAPSISAVTFSGSPANPTVMITGLGFNPEPATTNLGFSGSTGYDYGTSLHIADSTGSTAFSAGYYDPAAGRDDYIGLVVSSYSDTTISYQFGSNYVSYYYPNNIYELNEGDSFTVYVKGASFTGIVHYDCSGTAILSRGLGGQDMDAIFTPPSQLTLLDAANACGFTGFDWVQQITWFPSPSGLFTASNPLTPVIIPPQNPINDPPLGGWNRPSSFQPPFLGAYPYYYNPTSVPFGCAIQVSGECITYITQGSSTLNFHDTPTNPCLPGGDLAPGGAGATANQYSPECQGSSVTSPLLSFMAFTTQLVGICPNNYPFGNPSPLCSSSGPGQPSTPLYQWTWMSDYTGSIGGVYNVQASSSQVGDPGSGTGGVTITSINGIQLPTPVTASQISTTASGLAYSRVSQTFNGTLTIKNIGGSAITGPLQIVFLGLPANVILIGATSNLSGTPYLTVPAVVTLAPGQSSTVSVQFKNPSNATINFTPAIYSGSIN